MTLTTALLSVALPVSLLVFTQLAFVQCERDRELKKLEVHRHASFQHLQGNASGIATSNNDVGEHAHAGQAAQAEVNSTMSFPSDSWVACEGGKKVQLSTSKQCQIDQGASLCPASYGTYFYSKDLCSSCCCKSENVLTTSRTGGVLGSTRVATAQCNDDEFAQLKDAEKQLEIQRHTQLKEDQQARAQQQKQIRAAEEERSRRLKELPKKDKCESDQQPCQFPGTEHYSPNMPNGVYYTAAEGVCQQKQTCGGGDDSNTPCETLGEPCSITTSSGGTRRSPRRRSI